MEKEGKESGTWSSEAAQVNAQTENRTKPVTSNDDIMHSALHPPSSRQLGNRECP